MNESERQTMMRSMMEQFFSGMGANEKKEMCATMMGKMTEGLDMKEMMPKMMMPHCMGMMLPAIEPDKRGEVVAAILSTIVDKGSVGMSDEQKRSFLKALDDVLKPLSRRTTTS